MSFMNRIFGSKKEHQQSNNSQTTVTVVNDHTEKEDYVFISHNNDNNKSLSNTTQLVDLQSAPKGETNTVKIYDEIPFQLSPAYERLWLSETTTQKQSFPLKELDWDSLCYDFILEKSILQS